MASPSSPYTSFSKALSGASEALFPAASFGGIEDRVISNPNAANSVWVNLMGGTAAANGLDCTEVKAGITLRVENTNAVTVIGTAADKVTALQR